MIKSVSPLSLASFIVAQTFPVTLPSFMSAVLLEDQLPFVLDGIDDRNDAGVRRHSREVIDLPCRAPAHDDHDLALAGPDGIDGDDMIASGCRIRARSGSQGAVCTP